MQSSLLVHDVVILRYSVPNFVWYRLYELPSPMTEQSIPCGDARGLFQTLLAPSYETLPLSVRNVHHASHSITLQGTCKVMRGRSRLSGLMAFFARLPPAGDKVPIKVTIRREEGREHWIRRFDKHEMASTLTAANGLLHEALGPVRFLFRLHGSEQGIRWIPVGISAMGIPLPVGWFRFDVHERAEHDRYHFDVHVAIVGLGLLVHY
ncbi:MAG: DUF4166 domain-containing protein, partial [Noviherbaspirillum sp.]